MHDILIAAILGGCAIVMMLLGIPFYAIWTYHSRKVEEIKAKQKVEISEETRKAIEQIRKEVSTLRDTTTTYDLSFDTSLQRLESRMANMELRMGRVETSVPAAARPHEGEERIRESI